METQLFSTFFRELSLWGDSCQQIWESASAFDIYEEIINIDVLIEILVQQSNLYSQQTWSKFLTNA